MLRKDKSFMKQGTLEQDKEDENRENGSCYPKIQHDDGVQRKHGHLQNPQVLSSHLTRFGTGTNLTLVETSQMHRDSQINADTIEATAQLQCNTALLHPSWEKEGYCIEQMSPATIKLGLNPATRMATVLRMGLTFIC